MADEQRPYKEKLADLRVDNLRGSGNELSSDGHAPDSNNPHYLDPNALDHIGLDPGDDSDVAHLTARKDPLIGQSLKEHLDVISLIGEGGMSRVYKCFDRSLKRQCALKVMRSQIFADAKTVRRFQQEAIAVGKLQHTGIINVFSLISLDSGEPGIVMELVQGQSLSELLDRNKELDVRRVLAIMHQACEALEYAHRNGIIHRDLKPSNLMLVREKDGKETVKIVDFGIAKVIADVSHESTLTQTGEIFGSPLYMSPEQCSGSPLDKRSDVYALGCVMYEAITGQPPIQGVSLLDTLHRQVSDTPRPVEQVRPDLLNASMLNQVLFKAMAKDPAKRFQSMEEFSRAIAEIDLESFFPNATSKGGLKALLIAVGVISTLAVGGLYFCTADLKFDWAKSKPASSEKSHDFTTRIARPDPQLPLSAAEANRLFHGANDCLTVKEAGCWLLLTQYHLDDGDVFGALETVNKARAQSFIDKKQQAEFSYALDQLLFQAQVMSKKYGDSEDTYARIKKFEQAQRHEFWQQFRKGLSEPYSEKQALSLTKLAMQISESEIETLQKARPIVELDAYLQLHPGAFSLALRDYVIGETNKRFGDTAKVSETLKGSMDVLSNNAILLDPRTGSLFLRRALSDSVSEKTFLEPEFFVDRKKQLEKLKSDRAISASDAADVAANIELMYAINLSNNYKYLQSLAEKDSHEVLKSCERAINLGLEANDPEIVSEAYFGLAKLAHKDSSASRQYLFQSLFADERRMPIPLQGIKEKLQALAKEAPENSQSPFSERIHTIDRTLPSERYKNPSNVSDL